MVLSCNIIIIIIACGPYWSTGRLQELSRHRDPEPASQVVTAGVTRPLWFGLKRVIITYFVEG